MQRNKLPYRDMTYYTETVAKDDEGNPIKGTGDSVAFNGYMYPATDEVQVKIYGDKIHQINNLIIKDIACEIKHKDIVVDGATKYRVESIKPYTTHLLLEVMLQ